MRPRVITAGSKAPAQGLAQLGVDAVPVFSRGGEDRSRRDADASFQRLPAQIQGIDLLRQLHPDHEPSPGPGDARDRQDVLALSAGHEGYLTGKGTTPRRR